MFKCYLHLIADREFDPNKHCGVWVDDVQKQCTRSLTCKVGLLNSFKFSMGTIF